MSFDINPLSLQMHLKQLQREVERRRPVRNEQDYNSSDVGKVAHPRGWTAKLADLLAWPRFAE